MKKLEMNELKAKIKSLAERNRLADQIILLCF